MLSKNEVTRLNLADKRQIVRALLQSTFRSPRSFPLSYAQEQLWFMDKLQPGSPVYNIPLYMPFQGSFDLASLKKALAALIQRHDMLRVHFETGDEGPVQIVEPEVALDLHIEDLSTLPADQRGAAMGQWLNAEVQKPFDLAAGVCVRYTLIRLDSFNHVLCATMHHIVTDAWSLGVFVSEMNTVYGAYRSGQQASPLPPLPPLQVEYSDYARWQRANLRGLRLSKLVNYWTAQLAGAPSILQLPTDYPRPKDQTFNGTLDGFVFDDDLSAELIALCRQHKITLFMLLLACYYTLLYRYTGQQDLVVGAPVANRGRPELEPIIGMFVNTLILRVKLQDGQTFADLLKEVQAMSLAAFEHQTLPFEKLIDELNVERVPGYPPLYQAVFNFQNASLIESANPRAEGETMESGDFPFVHSNTAKVDLNLTVTQNESKISGGFEYNTDLFDSATIAAMIDHFKMIARKIVADPSISLMDIPLGLDVSETGPDGNDADNAGRRDQTRSIEDGEFNFELSD